MMAIKLRVITYNTKDGERYKLQCKRLLWPFWVNIVCVIGDFDSWLEIKLQGEDIQLKVCQIDEYDAKKHMNEILQALIKLKSRTRYKPRVVDSVKLDKNTEFIESI